MRRYQCLVTMKLRINRRKREGRGFEEPDHIRLYRTLDAWMDPLSEDTGISLLHGSRFGTE